MDPDKFVESEFSIPCSPDPTTNSETTNPKFSKIFDPIRWVLTKETITNKQTRLVKCF